MRAVDIIYKKRNKNPLSFEEIDFFVKGFVEGDIPDYQTAAFLMTVFFNGLSDDETTYLTKAMISSGKTLRLSEVDGVKVDKHSTGGVGDKLSLIIAPLVASCGLNIPTMCGRGLGHTGGTLDKLESIEGYDVFPDEKKVIEILKKCRFVFMGQTDDIVPADKKLYALRDVTATVESIPLIAASIMSKKIAEGTDCLVMDVKRGKGAFMKDEENARKLADSIINIGQKLNKKVSALITDMDEPLGKTIGNAVEVREAIEILRDCKISDDFNVQEEFRLSKDVIEISFKISEEMLVISGKTKDNKDAREMLKDALNSGRAYKLFLENVKLQGGNINSLDVIYSEKSEKIIAKKSGRIKSIDAYEFGVASTLLGCGRKKVTDSIDHSAGIVFSKKSGDLVKEGEEIATLFFNDCEEFEKTKKMCEEAIVID